MTLGEWITTKYNEWKEKQEIKKQKEETKKGLAKNAGFKIEGILDEGKDICYQITDGREPYEEVRVYDKVNRHWSFLSDRDYDGNVDSVWLGVTSQRIEKSGSELNYDSRHFDEATAREILDDANALFREGKTALGIDEKVKNYNPFYVNPLRKR